MTRNQVTWLLGRESNKINQQNADTNVINARTNRLNAETNVVNAQTNRANVQLAESESAYNRSANVWGNVISVVTTLATVLLAILL